MKLLILPVAIISILAIGVVGFAHDREGGKRSEGHMMGQGYDGHMKGEGGGGHMMGGSEVDDEAQKKFLDETVGLRRELHNKKFEYKEVLRNPDTTLETVKNLEKEIFNLKWKIREKSPDKDYGRTRGHSCW